MTQLNKKTIDAIKKVSDSIEGTGFFMNRFVVGQSGLGDNVIEFDIREIRDAVEKEGEQ